MEANILPDSKLRDLCRSFSWMLHSGISLADSAFLLAKDSDEAMLTELGCLLDQGIPLSGAMETSGVFPGYVSGMVRIGEETGRLEETLAQLADFLDRKQKIRHQLRSAVAYPAMILLLMLLVIGVLLVKVLPVFDQVYASLGSRLTGIAGGLLELGRWLEAALPVLLGLLLLAAVIAALFSLCPSLANRAASGIRCRWGDRGISRKYNNARFAQAMAMGLASGLTLEDTLDLACQLLSDVPNAASRCGLCAEKLKSGATLADAMEDAKLLDAARCRLLTVGLQSGHADTVMAQIAGDLSEEADTALENRISRIEPAMVLAASFLVGGILLAVMLPLMNILSSLG